MAGRAHGAVAEVLRASLAGTDRAREHAARHPQGEWGGRPWERPLVFIIRMMGNY